jgi:flagellar biosynthesis/type III secretory pathway protein FliH
LLKAVSDIKTLHDKLSTALEMVIENKAHQQGYEEGYRKGYEAGYEQALKDIRNAKVPEYRLKDLGLEYVKCAVCKKPLEGYVVKTGTKLTEAIKQHVYKNNYRHSYHDKVIK